MFILKFIIVPTSNLLTLGFAIPDNLGAGPLEDGVWGQGCNASRDVMP